MKEDKDAVNKLEKQFLSDIKNGKAQEAKKNLKEIVNKKIEIKSKIIEDNLELLKKKQK